MANEQSAVNFVNALGKALEGSGSIDEVDELVSVDAFKWQLQPTSLQTPEMDLAAFKGVISKTAESAQFSNVSPQINDTIVSGDKVILYLKNTAKSALGDYAVEAIYKFTFNDQGQIARFNEFVDSLSVANFQKGGDAPSVSG